jgi:hypothetical protein
MLTPSALRLSRNVRSLIYIIGVGVWFTGVLWLLLHHFFMQPGEFGMAPNPAEPWSLRAHAAFAFGTIWLLGVLSAGHIRKGWNSRRKRYSGLALVSTFVVLILSGYLLYYVGEERTRAFLSATHWLIGIAAPLAYVAHRLVRRHPSGSTQGRDVFRRRRHSRERIS